VSARKRGYSTLPVPLDEKMPKVVLKELIERVRPKKVHERVPEPAKSPTLETVFAEKKSKEA